jgi:hypothetical protein
MKLIAPLAIVALAVALCLPAAAQAASPQPPCQQAPSPGYAAEGAVPASGVWLADDLHRQGWAPPACLNWAGDSRLVAVLAGTFRSSLSLDLLVERITAVSAYPSIKYWSVSHQQWRPIALEAAPVARPATAAASDLYYAERGDMTGTSTHRLSVIERTPDRAVLVSQNVTPIRIAIITAFEPGALQLAIFIERAGPGLWHLYEITRVSSESSSLVSSSPSSYINRLDAFRRHLAGVPTDSEPPLKRN